MAENTALLTAVPPDIAASELTRPIERAVLAQQHVIAAIYDSVSHAEDIYREEHRELAGQIRLLHGSDVIRAAVQHAASTCRDEMLTAQPGGARAPEALARALPRDLEMAKRGVVQRTLYQHTVRTHGPTLAYVEQVSTAGAGVRTLDELFDRLIIFDRSIAFIPDPRHELSSTALAIEHPAIIHYLAKVFDHSWARAEPLGTTQENNRPLVLTDETRKAVLRLMVQGHTDAAIASRLGISARTVSTHIKRASELLGSRSRAHLAYLLARSELVEDCVV
ncbi:helix-turn-helix transcriptional regulator [Streptomyces luteolus]|uniref:LuxR C-terminal-related transcriptional regulator n=1 Tax=Streptomyces luteolus TaxID=3043615 RepID=A0ABT6SSB5_9ACTN|nr:LuxR C-terminal-related transcriptional regulator [Streptomyces sp. B-S-A12]MDI3418485.1 LuxR C-terminal-related transcriptional regulator [Streptomyces sp. B-S-A12]